jgi:hypothetical protein
VDSVEHVGELREDYERAPDAAESRGVAYHDAVLGLLERGGSSLQELADELGLTPQRGPVRPTVARQAPRRRNLARAGGGALGALLLVAGTLGGLRLAQAPPFAPTVRLPHVMNLPEAAAVKRVKEAGLDVQVISVRRDLPRSLFHRVLGVSGVAGEQLAKGSTVTLYVAIPRAHG